MFPTILHVLSTSLPVTAAGVIAATTSGGGGWGGKTVMLDYSVYDRAARFAKDKYHTSLRKYVNDYLGTALKKEELLERGGLKSHLTIVLVQGNHLYVKDDKIEELVDVAYREDEKRLECLKHGNDECVHVAYCLNSNELGKLLAAA